MNLINAMTEDFQKESILYLTENLDKIVTIVLDTEGYNFVMIYKNRIPEYENELEMSSREILSSMGDHVQFMLMD